MFQNSLYIGVDPTAGKNPFVCVALDDNLSITHKSSGDIFEILAFIANQQSCTVAVCAPFQPNQRIMEREDIRRTINPQLKPGRWTNYRLCEVILRTHRIKIIPTPANERDCPSWMKKGFLFYRHLSKMGFQRFPADDSANQFLEIYPHAAFTVLLGHHPLPKNSLEGRLQRQLLLYEKNLRVPDPMRFFEEVTRYKVLHGNFPMELVLLPTELDAMIAAYCAWLAKHSPSSISMLGDPEEGQIIIPAPEMKTRY